MSTYLITGTARGIGLALVENLSQNPNNTVFATVRKSSNLDGLNSLNRSNIHIIYSDFSDRKQVDDSFDEINSITDSIDYLILNGAKMLPSNTNLVDIYNAQDLTQQFENDTNDLIKSNVYDQIYFAVKFLPLVEKSSIKKIIVTSSGLADYDLGVDGNIDTRVPYSMSKAALNIGFERLAVTLKPKRITILLISPGAVNTTSLPEEKVMEIFKPFIAAGRRINPDFQGPVTPKQSAEDFIKTMEYFDFRNTGKFVSHYGGKFF